MNIKLLVTLVILGFSYLVQAQVYTPKQVRMANTQYRNENYCEAASMCSKAYDKIERGGKHARKMKGDMAFKTAECHRQTENMKDAQEWYQRAITLKYYEKEPMVYFYNAEMLRALGEHKKAKENYELYKGLMPSDKRADIGIRSCDIVQDFKINKTRHVVSNVAPLNKDVFEMAPMFGDRKDSQLVFSSTRQGGVSSMTDPRSCENYMDLWVSEIDKKGNFLEPHPLAGEGINTVDNEGTVCFDGRSKTMFFTRCPNEKKVNLGCDIWMSELKGKEWGEPTKLELKTHDSISVGHPCVTEDGKYLIFASDLPGGFGGKDLWYTTFDKKTNSWATPINMGKELNTSGNELFPTFALNGDLFFATDGMPGMGGLDMYRAAKVKDQMKWENPKNLGFPLNSPSNDYAIIEQTEKKGYFTSERVGSVGKNQRPDIWMYELPPNLYDLTVNTVDAFERTKRVPGVKVVVTADTGNDTWEGTTNDKGTIFWDKKPQNAERYINENNSYTITVSKEGYEAVGPQKFTTVGLNYDQSFVFNLPLVKKSPIRLPEVRYPLNKWTFVEDSTIMSKDSLLFVYNLMTEYPQMILELGSHTDSRSGFKYNQVLSENRAKACIKFLVEEKGIDARRFRAKGYGEMEPKTVWLKDGEYMAYEPADTTGWKEIQLTEKLIGTHKGTPKFEMLHGWNRRTEGRVVSMDFDPATAPPADPELFIFRPLPQNTKL